MPRKIVGSSRRRAARSLCSIRSRRACIWRSIGRRRFGFCLGNIAAAKIRDEQRKEEQSSGHHQNDEPKGDSAEIEHGQLREALHVPYRRWHTFVRLVGTPAGHERGRTRVRPATCPSLGHPGRVTRRASVGTSTPRPSPRRCCLRSSSRSSRHNDRWNTHCAHSECV